MYEYYFAFCVQSSLVLHGYAFAPGSECMQNHKKQEMAGY